MFERFTKAARATVVSAQEQAVATKASETRPEHLLGALLQDQSCLAVRVVEELGVSRASLLASLERHRLQHVDGLDDDDAEALRVIGIDLHEVKRRIDSNLGGLVGGRHGRRPRFSRPAKKVLQLALREAISLGHNYIGTEHILLGLLRAGDRVVADTAAETGLEHRVVRAAVADAVRKVG